jgi:predicted ribosomally synthesized peptide with nif11-like leader
MSTEKVAHFVKAVSEKPELNKKVAATEKSTTAWVQVGQQAGFDFSKDDFVGFVAKMTGTKVTEKDAVAVLLGHGKEMSDQQLDQVAGGAGMTMQAITISPRTISQIGSLLNLGNAAEGFIKTSGPSWAQSSGGFGGGQQVM